MAKKIILIFLGLCILTIGGLTAYISTIDWNTHKEEIAEKFSEITGQKIEFSGRISVSLLPTPTLKAQDINIVNPEKPSEKLAAISAMSTEVTLSSLLKGTPDVRSLALTGVEIWINVNDKNVLNWKNYQKNDFSEEGANTRLQSLSIQGAFLHYDNDYIGVHFNLSQINADIQSESLYGPYRLDGNFIKDNDHFGVAINIGDFSTLADIPLGFAVTHPNSDSYLQYDGIYMSNEGQFKGDFSGGSKKTADFANILSGMEVLGAEYNVPLQFSVGIETDDEKISLSSFIIKYSNFLEGSGSLLIPLHADSGEKRTINLKYQMVNLDLRPILSVLKAEYNTFKKNGSLYEPDTYYNIDADLSSERVILNDNELGYFENVSAKGNWTDNVLSLENFYAIGQGNTEMTMEGSLTEEKQTPVYFLKTSVKSNDFKAFLSSLNINIPTYTQTSYRNVNLDFNVNGNNTALSFNDLNFSMDKTDLTGSLGVTLNEDRNSYELQLNAGNLYLDHYLPPADKSLSFADNLKKDAEALDFLNRLNIHAVMHADSLTFRSAVFNKAALVFSTENNALHLDEFSAENVLNTSLKVSGSAENFGTADLKITDLNYELQSQNMNEIIEKFSLPWPEWDIFKAQSFNMNGTYQGTLSEGSVNVKTSADDTKFDYDGTVKQDEKFSFNGKFSLKTTNFGDFISKIGGTVKSDANTSGVLNCNSEISGSPAEWEFSNGECLFGMANYKGNGKISRDKGKISVTAKIDTDDLNIENLVSVTEDRHSSQAALLREDDFLPRPDWSRGSLTFDIYRNLILDIDLTAEKSAYKGDTCTNLHTRISNAENILQLNDLTANCKNIDIAGKLVFNYVQAPVVTGDLSLKNILLNNYGGSVYGFTSGTLDMATSFEGDAVSMADFINSFSGNIKISGKDFQIKGMDFAKINKDINDRKYSKGLFQQIRDNLQSGSTAFSAVNAEITAEKGSFKIDTADFSGNEASLTLTGMAGFNEWKMVTDFTALLPDGKKFSFSLSGMINKPGLEINITEIVRQYDEHWQQVEAQEKAEKEKQQQELNKKMENAQMEVQNVSQNVTKLQPLLENYKKESEDNSQIVWYGQQLEHLNTISKNTDEMQGKARLPEFTDNDVNTIKQKCEEYTKELSELEKQIQQHYEEDIASRLSLRKAQGAEVNAQVQDIIASDRNSQNENFNNLLKLNAGQAMVNNPKVTDLQKDVENAETEFNEYYAKYKAAAEELPDTATIAQKKELTEKLAQQITKLSALKEKISSAASLLDATLKEITAEQQAIFDKEKAEAEARQKALEKENEGNLLKEPEKEPQENTVKIKNAEPADKLAVSENKNNTENDSEKEEKLAETSDNTASAAEKTTILREISGDTENGTAAGGIIRKSYENSSTAAEEQQDSKKPLLREAEGTVSKVSGKIIVK